MADYQTKRMKVGSLLLDPMNSRIPEGRRSDDQRALLHELVEHDEVVPLAKSIAQLGLLPNERLVVMPSGGRFFTVLEGNRRLAAIKLLLNPELAQKTSDVSTARRAARSADLLALGTVDVVVMPDRISAAGMISSLHTGQAKRRWSRIQQGSYYKSLMEEGLSVDQVAQEVGKTPSEISLYLRAERLYRMVLALDLDSEIRDKVEDARKFPVTTLERFTDSATGQKGLGLEPHGVGDFRGKVHPDRFRAVLTRVVTDIATKPMSREVNTDEDMQEYFEQIEDELPTTKKRGSFRTADILGEEPQQDEEVPPEPNKKKRRTRRSKSVVPTGFSCTTRSRKVRKIFEELKKLDAKNQANSSGVMLRVLLDVSLWHYLNEEGLLDKAIDHANKKHKREKFSRDFTPPLRDLIRFVAKERVLKGVVAKEYNQIESLLSRDFGVSTATIDGLNEYTHSPSMQPNESELRAVWERAEPMLEVTLNV